VERIRRRAYEISQGPDAGTPEDNWLRAEEELRRGTPHGDVVREEQAEEARDAESATLEHAHIASLTHP
jgi:hypothetical protein